MVALILCGLSCGLFAASATGTIEVGMNQQQVRSILGSPDGRGKISGKPVWFFGRARVTFDQHDLVSKYEPNWGTGPVMNQAAAASKNDPGKAMCDEFVKILEEAGASKFVDTVKVKGAKFELTMKNGFVVQPYQLRLQMCQMLYKLARGISKDGAPPFRLVDMMGNDIGGAGAFSGPWVDK